MAWSIWGRGLGEGGGQNSHILHSFGSSLFKYHTTMGTENQTNKDQETKVPFMLLLTISKTKYPAEFNKELLF